jgi:magnesium chelatase family protein
MREIVGVAWERQQYRYKGTSIITNAHLTAKTIHHYITIDEKSEQFLHQVAKQYSFSSRVIHRLLRLARTIADIADSDEVIFEHVAEAFQYRNKALFVDE